MVDVALSLQLGDDVAHSVDGNCEADSDVALAPVSPVEIAELTPTTWPCAFSSGPPELPWLSAASVWMTRSMGVPSGEVSERWSALTIPSVMLRSRPSGFPIAATWSPT